MNASIVNSFSFGKYFQYFFESIFSKRKKKEKISNSFLVYPA